MTIKCINLYYNKKENIIIIGIFILLYFCKINSKIHKLDFLINLSVG